MSYSAPSHRETVHLYLTIRHVHHWPDIEKIFPIGEIDLCTAPVLRAALEDTDRRSVPNVLVDLSQVGFLAVAGVRVLEEASEQAERTSRRLALAAPTSAILRVFELTEATGALDIHASVPGALSALAPAS